VFNRSFSASVTVGLEGERKHRFPLILGFDAAGVVERFARALPLERAPEALEERRLGHVRGKLVLLVD
jgi:hypothetical protein